MTVIVDIREAAEKAAERYNNLVLSFKGAYDSALDRKDVFSHKAIETLSLDLYHIANTFVETEKELISLFLDTVLKNARREARDDLDVDIPESDELLTYASLRAISEHITHEIATQLERDVEHTIKRYKDVGLRVEIHRHATGWQYGASFTAVMMQEKGLRHHFRDRAGRKIPSARFVRATWRREFLHAYLEQYILEMAELGQKRLKVWHPNQDHRAFGKVISLVGDGLSFEDIKDDIFHPNSEALLRPV